MQITLHVVKLARWTIFKFTLLLCLQAERNIKRFCECRKILLYKKHVVIQD